MNVPGVVPAVKTPVVALMVPPPLTTDQTGVIATVLPPASRPTAVKVCCAPIARVAGFGVTVIDASGPTVTVTVAVPEIVPLVALTVLAKVPGVVPAVKRPVVLIAPPPATTDQTGVIATAFPKASLPTAVNCCVALIDSVTGFGVTVIEARGPAVTTTVAVAVIPRHVATIVFV